jgi:hypothetical protein
MPFWWFYPESWRQRLLAQWREKLPAWTEMVDNTRVLGKNQLQALFPGAQFYTETLLWIPKSYVVWFRQDRGRHG